MKPTTHPPVIAILRFTLIFCWLTAGRIPPTYALDVVNQPGPSFSPPDSGDGDSGDSIVSPDGGFVLFSSTANNLTTTGDNKSFESTFPAHMNVFLRNRTNGTTTLVSVNVDGSEGGNGDSFCTSISTNGRYALFESSARNLVPGDTNKATDIFVRDLVSGTTSLVSVGTNGSSASGDSFDSVMTPDGRYVAFASEANNLVPNDTNGIADIFVRDLLSGTTTLASPGARPATVTLPYGRVSSSDAPEITPDGRYVLFISTATNLVSGISTVGDIYRRDLLDGTTISASTGARVNFLNTNICYNHMMSDDGQTVVFEANLPKLVTLPTNTVLTGMIFRCDIQADFTEVIHTNAVLTTAGYKHVQSLDLSPDGRFIALVGKTNDGSGTAMTSVFLWDEQTEATTVVSLDLSNALPASSDCQSPTIDATGRFVSFLSTATNLTTNVVSTGDFHLYVRDLQFDTTRLVDVGTNGVGSSKGVLETSGLTPDGRFIAFDCDNADLTAGDRNRNADVFLRDLVAETTELISIRAPTLPTITGNGFVSSVLSASLDGRYVAFASSASDLTDNDTNGLRDLFVRDQFLGTNILVSVGTNGVSPGNGYSTDPVITPDGRYVVFISTADSLVANDTNRLQDVFVRDLATGTTELVSISTNGHSGNGSSYSFPSSISADGRYVIFSSYSSNLAPGPSLPFSATYNLFLRDRQLGTTTVLTTNNLIAGAMSAIGDMIAFTSTFGTWNVWESSAGQITKTGLGDFRALSPDGHRLAYSQTNYLKIRDLISDTDAVVGPSVPPPISRLARWTYGFSSDGRFLTYITAATNSIMDTNRTFDVYVYDSQTASNQLISQSFNGYSPNDMSDSPSISPDGRFLTYRSIARNIVPSITNGTPQIYLYDRENGTTTVVGASVLTGQAANHRAYNPIFSGDSGTLFFRSWASDLVFLDFNQNAEVFSWKLVSMNPAPVFSGQIIYAPTSGKSPTLTWPVVNGKTYKVQFKDDLSDPMWQPLTGNVTIVGDHGFATDLAPNQGQRFYRVKVY